MSEILVVTFTGPDRPGIVERLAAIVAEHGGNWEESRMASLAGRFAGILKVTAADSQIEALISALEALTGEGMGVLIDRGDLEQASDAQVLIIELTGADHEGIVHRMTRLLAQRGINIDEMTTSRYPAPMSAVPLFSAEARIEVPRELSLSEFRQELDVLAQELAVDIELRDG